VDMEMFNPNKKKLINDPVYGFMNLPSDLHFHLLEHRYFQRLRRIRQLGMGELVYPGATHTRFNHALGAMQLMRQALDILIQKDIDITSEEYDATCAAIMMHDIGHGPFSHTLEHALIENLKHEKISKLILEKINEEFEGKLNLTIQIFNNQYHKHFLHQLISSQLDMDRLDYLARDSFYTGVSEGVVSSDRIIHMLNVKDNQLVIEQKGIYSVEKFIIARRLMYWQVYLHKTVLAAEILLRQILRRAQKLCMNGNELFSTPFLMPFLLKSPKITDFEQDRDFWLEKFVLLDDSDIITSIKVWQFHPDKTLAHLSHCFINRKLPKISISTTPFSPETIEMKKNELILKYPISPDHIHYFVQDGIVENNAYKQDQMAIKILKKDQTIADVTEVSDNYNLSALKTTVRKYYLSYLT
jgi:HD superfamily phosphohydrolase